MLDTDQVLQLRKQKPGGADAADFPHPHWPCSHQHFLDMLVVPTHRHLSTCSTHGYGQIASARNLISTKNNNINHRGRRPIDQHRSFLSLSGSNSILQRILKIEPHLHINKLKMLIKIHL